MRKNLFASSKRRVALVGALIVGLLAPVAVSSGSVGAVAVSPSVSKYFLEGQASPVKGIKVSGLEGKNVLAVVNATAGAAATLSLATTTGLTLSFGYTSFTGSSISFVGTQDAVNSALQTLTVTVAKSSVNTPLRITTMFTEALDGLAFLPTNQHFYRFVAGKVTPDAAYTAAAASKEFGLTGYLATLTSAEENDFVASKIQGAVNVIVNGTDKDSEGTWKFVGGPEDGVTFWSGCFANSSTSPGTAVNGAYTKWNPEGEPNNWTSQTNKCGGTAYDPAASAGEDCIVTNWAGRSVAAQYRGGYWNDFGCTSDRGDSTDIGGYVIEYGTKTNGSTYGSGVDIRDHFLVKAIPTQKLSPFAKLFQAFFNGKKTLKKGFKIFVKKPATKTKPATKQLCPAQFAKIRYSYTLVFSEPGRYSFYFTDSKGKRIPMECGTKIKDRVITAPISAPVIQAVKANERPVITVYLKASSVWANPGPEYPQLNVILKRADGTLIKQDQPYPPLAGTPIR